MKKKYLVIAGIVTMMEAMLLGCGAASLTGSTGMSGGASFRAGGQQTQKMEGTQADDEEYAECGGPNGAKEQSRNMVLLDGKLYVDTYETNSMLRCGTMDGTITSTTDGAVPSEDGQSNFGKDIGFQLGMRENRIEVCLDDVWHVFAYNENNLKGVSLDIPKATKSGTVAVHNETDQEILFGEDFSLEMLDPSSKEWTYVPIVADGKWGFHEIAFPVSSSDTRNWEVDWTWLYGELMPGQYRIVKGILSEVKGEGMQTVGVAPM